LDNTGEDEIGLAARIEKVIEDFQTRTLDRMEGLFSRLIYLSSLRDYNTGRYYHTGLESRYGCEAVSEGLYQCHIQVFEELVSLPLKAQTDDLVRFFQSLREERSRLVDAWERLRSYQILPPEHSSPLARELFENNVGIILKILRETELWELLHEPHGDTDDLT
jgi:hypothetical protein